jgi:hypothetical protein
MYWLQDKRYTKTGDRCSFFQGNNKVVRINGQNIGLGTIICMYNYRKKPTGIIGYKDCNSSNTKIENLFESAKNFPKKSWLYNERDAEKNNVGDKRLSNRNFPVAAKTYINRGLSVPTINVPTPQSTRTYTLSYNNHNYKFEILKGKKVVARFRNEVLAKRKLAELTSLKP